MTIRKDKDGYVAKARCAKGHSGNRRYYLPHGAPYGECQGCGDFVSRDELRQRQKPEGAK